MSGNGIFKWYWATSEDAERWHGTADSREEAIREGRGEFPYEDFWICECDKSVMGVSFNSELVAEQIMDDLMENNEECFDEDSDGEAWPDPEAERALAVALEAAVSDWLTRFPAKTWTFGETRHVEKIKAPAIA